MAKAKPSSPKSLFLKAEKNLKAGKFLQAGQGFEHLISQGHTGYESFFGAGLSYLQMEQYDQAVARLQQAVMSDMRNPHGHYHLGMAQESLGQANDAIQSYMRAAKLQSDWMPPLTRGCRLLVIHGEEEQALPFAIRMCLLCPMEDAVWNNYKRITHEMNQAYPVEKELAPAIHKALEGNIGNGLRAAILRQIFFEPWIAAISDTGKIDDYDELISHHDSVIRQEGILEQIQEGFLPALMHRATITQNNLETLLTTIRRYLLLEASKEHKSALIPLLLAFWSLSFNNEYVFYADEEEKAALPQLRKRVETSLKDGEPNVIALALLGSYCPLADESFAEALSEWKPEDETLQRCLKEQIINPLNERERMQHIPMLSEIEDETSQKVREQYEHAPYPRWNEIPHYEPLDIRGYMDRFKVNGDLVKPLPKNASEALVAGAGTGQHPIMLSASLPKCKVLGIDISVASLSYGHRKAEEYNIQNLTLMQADILNLHDLNRQFDLIESAGVLHHMNDPMAGWRVLTDLLKPSGVMRIGLYSKIARKAIIMAREEMAKGESDFSDDSIRQHRRDIMKRIYEFQQTGKTDDRALTPHIGRLIEATDFFSLSDCRDLLFHVQEHQFTLPQIGECVKELGLEFIGLNLQHVPQLEAFEATLPPANDPAYLQKWHEYELEHPATFMGMYQFWLQKPS
jgi:SAM-dependent methyltransferase/tetratricopeptide (TPR) repeat protein